MISKEIVASAVDSVLKHIDGINSIKEEQLSAIEAICNRKDTVAFLPTGFGKSLIFQILPLVIKELGLDPNPIILVISPLVALIEDQVNAATKLGVTSSTLTVKAEHRIIEGNYSLLFANAETWLDAKWLDVISILRDRVFAIVSDEVHQVPKWGEADKPGKSAFREAFGRLGELRSHCKEGTPLVALTATADSTTRRKIHKIFQLRSDKVVIYASPDRPNIRLSVMKVSNDRMNFFNWLIEEVKQFGVNTPTTLIYCKSIKSVGLLYAYIMSLLKGKALTDDHCKALVGIYHSKTKPKQKQRVIDSLSSDGVCRVVLATTALGMGLNFPGIRRVVNYGPPNSIEELLQQIGRAGRDGKSADAIVYYSGQQTVRCSEAIKVLLKKPGCVRTNILTHFESTTQSMNPGHNCCSFCHQHCKCGGEQCSTELPFFERTTPENAKKETVRTVSDNEKCALKLCLKEHQLKLVSKSTPTFTTIGACTGFTDILIDSVIEHSQYIFTLDYVIDNLPVFSVQHAGEILFICSESFEDIDILAQFSDLLPEDTIMEIDASFQQYFDNSSPEYSSSDEHFSD